MKNIYHALFIVGCLAAMVSCQGMENENKPVTQEEISDFLKQYNNQLHYANSFDTRCTNAIIGAGKDYICVAGTFVDDNGTEKTKISLYKKDEENGKWKKKVDRVDSELRPIGIRFAEEDRQPIIVMLCNNLNDGKQCFVKFNTKLKEQYFNYTHNDLWEKKDSSAESIVVRKSELITQNVHSHLDDNTFDVFGNYIVYRLSQSKSDHKGLVICALNGTILKFYREVESISDSIKKIRFCNATYEHENDKLPFILLFFNNNYKAYTLYNLTNRFLKNEKNDTPITLNQVHPLEGKDSSLPENFDMDYARTTLFHCDNINRESGGLYSQLETDWAKAQIEKNKKVTMDMYSTTGTFSNKPSPQTSFVTKLFNKLAGNTISIESMQSYNGEAVLRVEKPGFFTPRKATIFYKHKAIFDNDRVEPNKDKSANFHQGITFPFAFDRAVVLSSGGVALLIGNMLYFFDSTASRTTFNEALNEQKENRTSALQQQVLTNIKEKIQETEQTKRKDSWWWGTAKKLAPLAIAAGVTYMGYKGLQQLKQKQK